MGFRINIGVLLFLIVADCIFTVVRPTTMDADGTMNVAVLDYVLIAAHSVTVLAEGGAIFQLWSGTVLFTAGLLGELLESAYVTLPLLFFHLLFLVLSWVVRNFASSASFDVSMTDNANMFLYVVDQLVAVATWCSLVYTAGALTEKRMYAPYHREHVELPQDALKEQRRRIQAFQINQQAQAIEQQQRQLEQLQQRQVQNQQGLFQQQQQEEMRPTAGGGAGGGAPPPGVEDAGIVTE